MASRNKWACVMRPLEKYWNGRDPTAFEQPPNLLNDEYLLSVNAAGTGTVSLIKADTSNCIRLTATSPAFTRIDGMVKMFNRPTGMADAFAVQIKSEFQDTDALHNCLEVTADCKANLTTGGGHTAVQGVSRLAATYTASGTASFCGTYGQFCNLGTLNGAGIMACGLYGLIEDGGTYTAVSHVAAAWLDSHLTQTISAGNAELLYLTNNGSTTLNSVFFIYPGNKITNLFTIDPTATGMVSANTAGAISAITNWRLITCKIAGETHYLIAAKGVA